MQFKISLQKLFATVGIISTFFAVPSLAVATLTIGADSLSASTGTLAVTGDTTFSGNLGVAGAPIDSTKLINVVKSANADNIGIYSSVTGTGNNSSTGGYFIASVSGGTGSGSPVSAGLVTQGQNALASTILVTEGAELNGSNSGTTSKFYGSYSQAVNTGTVSTLANAVYARYANFGTVAIGSAVTAQIWRGSGTFSDARGVDISGWTGANVPTVSYGIYMDTSIDVGTTKYALYSSSVSDSYLQGNLGLGTASPSAKLDVNSDTIRVRTAKTPASAAAACAQGEIVWDTSFVYVCVATNTWKRAAIATW